MGASCYAQRSTNIDRWLRLAFSGVSFTVKLHEYRVLQPQKYRSSGRVVTHAGRTSGAVNSAQDKRKLRCLLGLRPHRIRANFAVWWVSVRIGLEKTSLSGGSSSAQDKRKLRCLVGLRSHRIRENFAVWTRENFAVWWVSVRRGLEKTSLSGGSPSAED
ncbi:hypothetical protein RRG08_013988 [Elysia crispata]|uniref:Uncharacterized protein n=1 Tax=Elysia crispata TaxID=231223 RepID=A0AAE1CVT0_9GAST|nr:hypothetical protein RRG08_013988 [Elysia crispata]